MSDHAMNRRTLLLASLALTLPLAGCLEGGAKTGRTVEDPPVLTQGRDSFVENPTVILARNETAWESQLSDLWTFYHGSEEGMPPVPEVDFDDEMAIAYFEGTSEDVCQGLTIDEVRREPAASAQRARTARRARDGVHGHRSLRSLRIQLARADRRGPPDGR